MLRSRIITEVKTVKVILLTPILWCALNWTLTCGQYFPPHTESVAEGITAFHEHESREFLARINEPPLSEFTKDADAEVYQMTIFPSWGDTILVRVQRQGGVYSLSGRRLEGQAGFEQGKLVEAKDFKLNADDSITLKRLLQNLNFFRLSKDDNVRGTDGDEWFLEGVSQGKHHIVQRWCASSCNPEKRGLKAFLNLCKFLVDKSTLSQRPRNKGRKLI
jgi:hypothetical protein